MIKDSLDKFVSDDSMEKRRTAVGIKKLTDLHLCVMVGYFEKQNFATIEYF